VVICVGFSMGGMIGIVTLSLQEINSPQALVDIDIKSGRQNKVLQFKESVGGILPSCFTKVIDKNAVLCALGPTGDSCLVLFSTVDASIVNTRCFSDLVVDNIAYDFNLNKFFFNAYNMTEKY